MYMYVRFRLRTIFLMAEEEEVLSEVEAVQAVYDDDCIVFDNYPPHLHVHIKPRTAEVSSQQFVEAVLAIRGGPQYPNKPPHIDIIESKGLDEQRKKHLINSMRDKACELSSCLMLLALVEEAVERLSIMNHPDGNCPLCLYPLVPESERCNTLPFMKLMSCFHCFHSECIIRWWNWIQTQKEASSNISSSAIVHSSRDINNKQGVSGTMEESMGLCPVCRVVFTAKDLEHVQDLVGTQSPQLSFLGAEGSEDEGLLQSDSENVRRQRFEAVLKIQQEKSGIIEPRKDLHVVPGMFLPQSNAPPTTMSTEETTDQPDRSPTVICETNSGGSTNRVGTSDHRNSWRRKPRVQNSRKQVKQWIKKENGTGN